jgi:hypothetical protein
VARRRTSTTSRPLWSALMAMASPLPIPSTILF